MPRYLVSWQEEWTVNRSAIIEADSRDELNEKWEEGEWTEPTQDITDQQFDGDIDDLECTVI